MPKREFPVVSDGRAVGERPPVLKPRSLRTHYTARIRPIMLLFPHLDSPLSSQMRRKAPVTSTRSPETKTARHCLAVRSLCLTPATYFDAVGSGTGLSDSVRR